MLFKKCFYIYGTAEKCTTFLLGPMQKLRPMGTNIWEDHDPLDYETQLKQASLDGNICL